MYYLTVLREMDPELVTRLRFSYGRGASFWRRGRACALAFSGFYSHRLPAGALPTQPMSAGAGAALLLLPRRDPVMASGSHTCSGGQPTSGPSSYPSRRCPCSTSGPVGSGPEAEDVGRLLWAEGPLSSLPQTGRRAGGPIV